jgi:hypothetical protein
MKIIFSKKSIFVLYGVKNINIFYFKIHETYYLSKTFYDDGIVCQFKPSSFKRSLTNLNKLSSRKI